MVFTSVKKKKQTLFAEVSVVFSWLVFSWLVAFLNYTGGVQNSALQISRVQWSGDSHIMGVEGERPRMKVNMRIKEIVKRRGFTRKLFYSTIIRGLSVRSRLLRQEGRKKNGSQLVFDE